MYKNKVPSSIKIIQKYPLKEGDIITGENKDYILKIKDLEDEDKPREKLIKKGPENLSSSELLSVILNIGTKKEEVSLMTSRILKEYGEKNIANQRNVKTLSDEADIPEIKAAQIVACFELGRRFFGDTNKRVTIKNARQAYNYLREMGNLPKEQLRGLYLNSRYKIIHDEVISVGSLTANIVHPREVFRPAIESQAVAIIIAHNHPSGNVSPTSEDIEVTNRLIEVGKILGINILDHIIVGKKSFASVPAEYNQD